VYITTGNVKYAAETPVPESEQQIVEEIQ